MADITIFDVAAAEQACSTFESKMTAMVEACNKMNTTVQNLTGDVWSGASATTYFGQFFQMYANLSKTQPKVEGAISRLKQAISMYEQVQSEIGGMVDSLEEGTTPPMF